MPQEESRHNRDDPSHRQAATSKFHWYGDIHGKLCASSLSSHRAMLKQDAFFHWNELANSSFQKIRDLIAKTASQPLRYYDRTKPVTVQVDASQRGLGACLVQEGQPIAFASKSLTDTEIRYANIERELLAIVFGCQRFNMYVLGRQFTVEIDHKPLEMIHQKSLGSTSPRLQRMLLQLQRYDLTIRYKPGKDMMH